MPRSTTAAGRWQDQFLVGLDLASGNKLWEKPLDVEGRVVVYLAYGGGRLVLVSSDVKYHVYAFDAVDGRSAWDVHFDWSSDNHGGHMSRPAIVGDWVFVRPKMLNLSTGQMGALPVPKGGCGTYAAAAHSLVYRAGFSPVIGDVGRRRDHSLVCSLRPVDRGVAVG